MNRRSFLKMCSVLSLTPPLVLFADDPPEPSNDPFEIMTPAEIKAWLGDDRYVATPVFKRGGASYCVKTWKLKLRVSTDYADAVARYGNVARRLSKQMAITEITRLGLTHIHSVRFCERSVVAIPDGLPSFHCAFVRGATVKVL